MILLRLISWPYARKHLLRWLLTMTGIVLGVAVFVGMHTANQSVLAAFHQTIERIAGSTQLQVSAGEAGFDEEILDRVRSQPGVRAASPVIEATVSVSGNNLLILGVDMLGDRNLRKYDLEGADDAIDDPLVFLAQPDSLLVTKTFADQKGLTINSRIAMGTMAGNQTFTVRGVMKPTGVATAFGGNLAIMDIYSAQKIFGRGRKFDRVDLALDDGVTLAEATANLQKALGPGFQVELPSTRGQQFETTSHVYSLVSSITSVFALFIGMFIIYNTLAIAVAQRRTEIGILRALGAMRSQIRTLFLCESAITGIAGSVIGALCGILMARGLANYIGGLLASVYGVAQSADEITLDPLLLTLAVSMGVVTSLIAGVLPARNAAGVDPVKALQKGRYQALSEGENRTRRNWALGCAAGSLVAVWFGRIGIAFYIGYFLAVLAAVLLTPVLTFWLARLLRPLLAWIRPVEGTLAADSLIRAPRRTSGTVAALMLSLALVVSLGGLSQASYDSIMDWMRVSLSPDLFVTTGENINDHAFVFPADLGNQLRMVEGISEVQFVRDVRVLINGTPIMLVAADIRSLMEHNNLSAREGNPEEMSRLTAAGKGIIVSQSFSRLHGVRFGETLEIPAPNGILRLPVVGITQDFSDQQGSLLIDRSVFIRGWNDDTVNVYRLYLKPGAGEAQVRKRILDSFGSRQRLFVLTNHEIRDFIKRIADQWFGLTYVQIAVAVLVAVLGIVNALTVSITDRFRELGVLRAVGGLRRQIRHTIWMEAVAVAAIGLTLGLALGAIQLYYSLVVAQRDLIGMDIGYTYPFRVALFLIPILLGAAFLAALGPAESAARGSLVEALEYE